MKIKMRFLCAVLALAFVCTACVGAPAADRQSEERTPVQAVTLAAAAEPAPAYTDVPNGIWYTDAVLWCRENGVMSGTSDTTFAPNAVMSRAMLATVLYHAAGSPAATGGTHFTDVPDGQWYSDAVAWASANGYISGYGGGIFGANDPVTREQTVTILWHYSGSPAATAEAFADEGSISSYASAAVDWARSNSIMGGVGENRFDPQGELTRAQAAQILMGYDKMLRSPSAPAPEETKILVAYFSATNNTGGVAQKLADGLGADLYEITPEQPYTSADLNYGSGSSRTSAERNDPDARPTISGAVEDMEQYDVVFLGYPIWWGEAPRIMSTFIESYDFKGKTIVPFCTSGSSGFGSSDSALRAAVTTATWLNGHRFSDGASAEDVLAWANSLGLDIE